MQRDIIICILVTSVIMVVIGKNFVYNKNISATREVNLKTIEIKIKLQLNGKFIFNKEDVVFGCLLFPYFAFSSSLGLSLVNISF